MATKTCSNCGSSLPEDLPLGGCPKCLLNLALADHPENVWEGQTVSQFQIVTKIGQGGMGEVYLAEDASLKRQVALKFLPASLENDVAARKRFLREAESAAALDHPFICSIHEIACARDGQHFIVMEFVEGQTLSSRLAEGPLTMEEVHRIGCEVAEALEEAHDKGIVHRDLKPSNIMLTRKGHAKVMDFGLAKRLSKNSAVEQETTSPLTGEGAPLGTVAYMSPEQALGQPMDHRSDLFSFGVVLYEMLAGRHPFRSETAAGVVNAVLNEEPEPLDRKIPASLRILVTKLLSKGPHERIQSSRQLVENLETISTSSDLPLSFKRPLPRRWVLWTLLLFFALLLLLFISLDLPETWQSDPGIESLAVLPLENHSGDPDQDYLADGMTYSLIQELGQIRALRVVSRTSVMRYRDSSASLSEIAEELGVDAILEGETARAGESVVVTARLIDADSDQIVWGETYNRKYEDIKKLQGEVAQSIALKIRINLTPDESARLANSEVVNPDAYEAYLRGRYFWGKRSVENLEKAVNYFKTAISIDSECALAFAGLADAYALLGDSFGEEYPRRTMMEEVRKAALTALEIDDSLAEAHTALANASFSYDWDFAMAEKEFELALDINPDYATARHWYGLFLASRNRLDEAFSEVQIAQKLDPVSAVNNAGLARCSYYRREYDQATSYYQRALELDPLFEPAHLGLALVLLQQGNIDEAVEEFGSGLPDLESSEILLEALEQAALGNVEKVEALAAAVVEKEGKASPPSEYLAVVYTVAGRNDDAFVWLEKALEERSELMLYLGVDPIFESLKDDTQFESLLRRVDGVSGD